jgi:hypothetical protein
VSSDAIVERARENAVSSIDAVSSIKATVRHAEHGEFQQQPASHIAGVAARSARTRPRRMQVVGASRVHPPQSPTQGMRSSDIEKL